METIYKNISVEKKQRKRMQYMDWEQMVLQRKTR